MLNHTEASVHPDSRPQPCRFVTWIRLALFVLLALLSVACKQLPPTQLAQEQLAKARESVKQGKINEAIIEYRRAIQTDSKLPVLHFELGKLYIERQDYITGARQLNAAIQ